MKAEEAYFLAMYYKRLASTMRQSLVYYDKSMPTQHKFFHENALMDLTGMMDEMKEVIKAATDEEEEQKERYIFFIEQEGGR